jgi:hypothetical protein
MGGRERSFARLAIFFFKLTFFFLRLAQLCPAQKSAKRGCARGTWQKQIFLGSAAPYSPSGTTPRRHSSARAPVATQRPRTGLSDQPTYPLASS